MLGLIFAVSNGTQFEADQGNDILTHTKSQLKTILILEFPDPVYQFLTSQLANALLNSTDAIRFGKNLSNAQSFYIRALLCDHQ